MCVCGGQARRRWDERHELRHEWSERGGNGRREKGQASPLWRLSPLASRLPSVRAACAARGWRLPSAMQSADCTGPSGRPSRPAVACRGFNVIVDVVIYY